MGKTQDLDLENMNLVREDSVESAMKKDIDKKWFKYILKKIVPSEL